MKTISEAVADYQSNPQDFFTRYESMMGEVLKDPRVLTLAMIMREQPDSVMSMQIARAIALGVCIGIEMEKRDL